MSHHVGPTTGGTRHETASAAADRGPRALREPDVFGHPSGGRRPGRQGAAAPGPSRRDDQGEDGGALYRGHSAPGRLLLQVQPRRGQTDERAPVELDKRLGGVIASLRERGEFVGERLETLLITPPRDSIKAKALLLVGLGDESSLSLELMEAVGRVSLREAARLGASRVAFAPLIRDQGNSKLGTGDVETAVVRGCCSPTTRRSGSRRRG